MPQILTRVREVEVMERVLGRTDGEVEDYQNSAEFVEQMCTAMAGRPRTL